MAAMSHRVVLAWRRYYVMQDRFSAGGAAYEAALRELNVSHAASVAGSSASDEAEAKWSRILWSRNVERDQMNEAYDRAWRMELAEAREERE